MSLPQIVGLSGSTSRPSRTTALVEALLENLSDLGPCRLIELADEAPQLASALSPAALTGRAASTVAAVEAADLLVVGTPVYRGSYPGLFKHLFDLVDHRALAGTPVVLAATGGSALHALMIEHQLRPLFGFFSALTLPTGVYATEADFDGYALSGERVRERAARAAAEARAQLGLRFPTRAAAPATPALA